MIDNGKYALLHANGMPLRDVLALMQTELVSYMQTNHYSNGGKPCVGNRCHVRQVVKALSQED